MQLIDSTEIFAYGKRKYLVSKKEDIKYNNIIIRYEKTIKFDYTIKEDIKENNPNWPEILDHPYRILTTGGSWKTNPLLNLIT